MSATSVTGIGQGSAEGNFNGPGNNRNLYQPLNGPMSVVAVGECITNQDTHGNWQVVVEFPTPLSEGPDLYAVFAMQSDSANNDSRNQYPPHIEKLDANGNNKSQGWDSPMGGFVLHTGDSQERTFMYMVVRYGFIAS